MTIQSKKVPNDALLVFVCPKTMDPRVAASKALKDWKGQHPEAGMVARFGAVFGVYLKTWSAQVYGNWLTSSIVKVDQGWYSHVAMADNAKVWDARVVRHGGKHPRHTSVAETSLGGLAKARQVDYYDYRNNGGKVDRAKVSTVVKAMKGRYKTSSPVSDPNPSIFTVGGMARLAILRLTDRSSGFLGRFFARLILRFGLRRDPKGLFCSEFVAKSFTEGNVPLKVKIDGQRGLARKSDKKFILKVMKRREDDSPFMPPDWEEAFDRFFEAHEEVNSAPSFLPKELDVSVFPAWLVTVKDLQDSPSLTIRPDSECHKPPPKPRPKAPVDPTD